MVHRQADYATNNFGIGRGLFLCYERTINLVLLGRRFASAVFDFIGIVFLVSLRRIPVNEVEKFECLDFIVDF